MNAQRIANQHHAFKPFFPNGENGCIGLADAKSQAASGKGLIP